MKNLIDKLNLQKKLSHAEWVRLIEGYSPEIAEYAAAAADKIRREIFGTDVYIRGLIEISNYCKNNCLYCGIQNSNRALARYRLTEDEILNCCREGFRLGFRTFVMQGGEDAYFTDEVLCRIIGRIKGEFPECAVTLSLGERSRESYQMLFDAGADRYLLRHETADKEHYNYLHNGKMSFENRMECLKNLKNIGFQTGCGFMVGSPHQTAECLAKDMEFICAFKPQMVGIGPFVSHHATVFANEKNGSVDLTLFLLSLVRIMHPKVLLPATTALAALSHDGRERGIKSGANVVMPNLSPLKDRKKYALYDNKPSTDAEAAEGLSELKERMEKAGYRVVVTRGDFCECVNASV